MGSSPTAATPPLLRKVIRTHQLGGEQWTEIWLGDDRLGFVWMDHEGRYRVFCNVAPVDTIEEAARLLVEAALDAALDGVKRASERRLALRRAVAA